MKVGGGVHRGTSNRNARGSAESRRRRKAWLVETYRADRDKHVLVDCTDNWCPQTHVYVVDGRCHSITVPSCRCYRCGALLTVETVTVDRILPGCQGGTYRRENCRPACAGCNSETGAKVRGKP